MNGAISTDVSVVRKIREIQWEYLAIMMAFVAYVMVELMMSLMSNKSLVRLVHDKKKAMRADYLTSISNRMFFEECLAAQDRTSEFGVVYFDLDGFKKINDTLGHLAGDKLLACVAATLRANAWDGDVVSRFGGDEFAALVYGDKARSSQFASAVVRAISKGFEIDGQFVQATASAGVCHRSDQPVHTPVKDLMRKADLALYKAKYSGKNSVELFSLDLLAQRERRLKLEQGIAEAIESGEIDVVFQPIVNLETNRVQGIEALVRWCHSEYGHVSPMEVCDIAKQGGQILPLTMRVIEHACRIGGSVTFMGHDFHVAINILPDLLGQSGFARHVADAVRQWSMEPAQVVLEITEQSIDPDAGETVADNVRWLKDAGFQLALDDFGTGQSNLVRLSNAEFRVLKLDKSLIDHVHTNQKDAQIVAAISRLAGEIGMATVAEGAETLEQVAFLRDCGISSVQGYIVARPMSAASTLRFLVENADGVTNLRQSVRAQLGETAAV